MTPAVVGLILCAAILHATWNAMLRRGADRLWSVTAMSLVTTAISIPIALLLPLPALASWPYLCLSSSLQVGYSLVLVLAYRQAELGQVYPIIRGSVPLLATIGAAVLAGEHLGLASVTGIGLVSAGIMGLAFGKRSAEPMAIAAALSAGFIVASYTVTDGLGARLAGNPYAYAIWIFVLYGALMPLAFLAVRRKPLIAIDRRETMTAVVAGLVQLLTYGVVIWAFTLSPIGPVSALRETSVVFAALIGRVFLRERLTMGRLGACVVIALGAFVLSYRP